MCTVAEATAPSSTGQALAMVLNDLLGASVLERTWTPAMAAAGPGSVYLTGPAAEAAACDAVLTTMVTGQIDWAVLDQLTTLWLALHGHADGPQEDHTDESPENHAEGRQGSHTDGPQEDPRDPGCLEATRQRVHATILRWSLDLLSGPGGLASHLRGTLLGAPFNTPSQPLDIGRTTRTIPPHPRTAVIQRDQHCVFPGCIQPPAVCEVHHLIPWANGGPTSLGNLRLLCRFHHRVVIHQWGWKITCQPDGTRTATAPDGRTLHSHGPPQQAA